MLGEVDIADIAERSQPWLCEVEKCGRGTPWKILGRYYVCEDHVRAWGNGQSLHFNNGDLISGVKHE